MPDFDQDIIRTVRIQTQADEESIRRASTTLDNFYKKYQTTSVKVDTKDFFQAVDAVRSLRKELESTKKSSPHMEGIIGHMSSQLENAGQQFERIIVKFTNGDIAHGLNEAVDKISSGLSIHAVDLGDFLSTTQRHIKDTVDALKNIGAITTGFNDKNFLSLNDLKTEQLQEAIVLIQRLKEEQENLESFESQPLKSGDLYSGTTTRILTSRLEQAQDDLYELKRLNIETVAELQRRRNIESNINGDAFGRYDEWDFRDIKESAKNDNEVYESALSNLREYLTERSDLLQRLQDNSYLFTTDEINNYTNTLNRNIDQTKLQIQELQQIGGSNIDTSMSGDFIELVDTLNQIKDSLQIISDVIQNENNSMRTMAENGVSSFTSLSQVIVEVYNNLISVQSLVDSISKKDFNITNVTNAVPTYSPTSKRETVKSLKAEVEAEMQHVKALYGEIDNLFSQLKAKRMNAEIFQLSNIINELESPTYSDFEQTMLSSMADAKTKAKIENLLVMIDGYTAKLIEVNKLRNKYGFGEWQDSFVSGSQSTTQSEAHIANANAMQQEADARTALNKANQDSQTTQDNSEANQMSLLKTAVDEVSKAIGRKNAGFIKEKEIVDVSVEAEKTKLKELVGVITNDIGNALDAIKLKFEQSFVVPELDRNTLQVAFDEIYNQFIDLRDKIGTMQFDIGIDSANITTAIQEALYAKEIAKNYTKITSFDQVFDDFTWGYDLEAMNKFTNEIISLEEARERFSDDFYGKFISNDGKFVGDTNEMLSNLMQQINSNVGQDQSQFAQVIVNAINTQGNQIVETIKLLLPKNITNESVDEIGLTNAFQTLSNYLLDLRQTYGTRPGNFFHGLQTGYTDLNSLDTDVLGALKTLGLVSNAGEIQFVMPDTGFRNLGVAIAEKLVVSSQNAGNVDNVSELMKRLNEASQLGAAVPRILSVLDKNGMIFELQERAIGTNIASPSANNEFLSASTEQIDRLIHTFEVLEKVGVYPDFIGDNVLFDDKAGFSLIDLDTEDIHWGAASNAQGMIDVFLRKLSHDFPSYIIDDFSKKVRDRAALPANQRLVNDNTVAAELAAKQHEDDVTRYDVKLTPTMDEGAVAKVVDENVTKTPATVKIKPVIDDANQLEQDIDDYDDVLIVDYDDLNVIDSALDTQQSVDDESQSAIDAAKAFVDAANAKKQFVEANKKVAETAKVSAEEVEKEAEAAEDVKQTMTAFADDTVQPTSWDKVIQRQTDHGEDPFSLSRSHTENVANKSVRTITESWSAIRDEDGELTGEMKLDTVTIINDYKKRTDAITKENEKIKTAQAYLQKFLTQFDNKTMGKGNLLNGYKDLVDLANSADFKVDDIARAEQMMSNLDAEYNKVVQSMRKGSSSMNPFVNAINSMDKMEDVLRGILLQFKTLDQQPDWLKNDVIGLFKQLDDLSVETDIYKFAEGFGNLKVSINSVTESLRQQRAEQKLAKADFSALVKATKERDANTEKAAKEEDGSIWKSYYLDRAAEQQKIIDAIQIGVTLTEKQETQLNAMAEKHALILRDINLENTQVEAQKQKYQDLVKLINQNNKNQIGLDNGTLKVIDKDTYQKRLNNEREQIHALIANTELTPQQTKSLERLVNLIASIRVESSNIDLLSKKWEEQNILTDEAKSKIEGLKNALLNVTSNNGLKLWKKQWKELANQMSMANIDAKEDKKINKLIEDDRVAKVKEYLDLLKLKHDYEKKAAQEDDGSKMQSFYNDQITKVKEKLEKIDIQAIENQDEKNKRLAIEEAHQRAIAEIKEKQREKANFTTEETNVREKHEAGYLSDDLYNYWQEELAEYRNYINGVTQADETTIKQKKQHLTQLYDSITKMSNASKSFFASGGEILPQDMWLDKQQIDDMSNSLRNLYNNIISERFDGMKTSVTSVKGELGKLTFTVDDGSGSLAQYTIQANKATGAIKLLADSTKPTLTALQRLGRSLTKDFTGLLTAIVGGSSIQTFVQYMRKGIESVRQLDLALTELKKVTDETEETYDRFLETAATTSSRIGSTLSNMTSATAEFAKLGYDVRQAAEMAEAALVYTNVGDNVDVETGSQSIISTLKAFGIEANNTMSIVDKFNEVGNNFAITTKGIGDALQVSASAMAAAGNTLDETIALTTAANTIVQNPNTVGTALKTLSLRIRGVKTELEEAGLEVDGMAETTSQLQQKLLALTNGKVNVMLDSNNFKNTTQILREMSAVWEDMTDVQQAAALELLGGKRQANVLSAIISNFDIVEDAIQKSANSAGSALEENAKVLDSIQGRINLFNNALEAMWNNTLDDDLIKGVVDFGTKVIKLIDKLGPEVTLLATLFATKILPSVLEAKLEVEDFGSVLKHFAFGAQYTNSSIGEIILSLGKMIPTMGKGVATAGKAIPQLVNAGYAFGGLKGAFAGATAGIQGLWAAIPGVGQIMLIVAAIGAVVSVVDALTTSTKEAAEITKEAMMEYKNTQDTLRSHRSTINDIKDEYENLADGVDDLGNNVSLTTEEYSRYNEITNQIADMFPQMVSGYTEEGNAIIKLKGNVEELTKAYEEEAKAARQALLENSKEIVKNSYNTSGQAFYGDDGFWKNALKGWGETFSFGIWQSSAGNKEISKLQDYVNGEKKLYGGSEVESRLLQSLKDLGADISWFEVFTGSKKALDRVIDENRDLVETLINQFDTDLSEAAKNNRTVIDAYLENSSDFQGLDDNTKNVIHQVVQNLDDEFVTSFKNNKELYSWINSHLISGLGAIGDYEKAEVQIGFNLMTQFNNGEVSIEDYQAKIKEIIDLIDALNLENEDEVLKSFRLIFGVDEDGKIDSARQEIAKDLLDDSGDAMVGQLSKSDLDIIEKYKDEWKIDDNTVYTWEELQNKLAEVKKEINDSSITDSLSAISSLENAYNSLGEAMQEFKEDGTVAAKTLEDLHEVFGEVDGFEELYQVLATGEGDAAEAISNVANAYITKHGILSDLTDDEIKIMSSRLQALGVLNADEVLQQRQTAQQVLDDKLIGYDVDLGNYATAEEAKIAIASMAGLDLGMITDDNFTHLLEKYGDEVDAFADKEKQKIQIAQAAAREQAAETRDTALEDLDVKSEDYSAKKQAIENQYSSKINSINQMGTALGTIDSILNNYYSQRFKFNFSGNKIGIGRNYNDEITDKVSKQLDNIKKKYENDIALLDAQKTYLENDIAQMEAKGEQVGSAIYKEQIDLENEKVKLLGKERDALLEQMASVPKGSEEWYEYANAVWEVEHAMQESALTVIELEQKITDLYVNAFTKVEEAHKNMQQLHQYQEDYLRNNIEYNELTDQPVYADHYKQIMESQKKAYLDARAQVTDLQAVLAQGIADGSIEEGSEEWVDLQFRIYDATTAAQQARNAIEQTNDELKQLYVTAADKVQEAFDALNDLYSDRQTSADNYAQYLELTGQDVPQYVYEYQREQARNKLDANIAEYNNLAKKLQDGINNGDIAEGDETYVDYITRMRELRLETEQETIAIEEYTNKIKELYTASFDKTTSAFDSLNSLYGDRKSYIENYMNYQELLGKTPSKEAYDYLIEQENDSLNSNLAKLEAQRTKQAEAIANGVQVGSEDWVRMEEEIRATEAAILDNKIALVEYNEKLKNLYADVFTKIHDAFGNKADIYDDQQAYIESYMDYMEASGVTVPAEMYEELIGVEQEKQNTNIQRLEELRAQLAKMEANGFTAEDEEWVTANAEIRAVEKSIIDSDVAMAQWNKTIREMETEKFEEFAKRINDVAEELDRVNNLFSDEDVATEDGAWTEYGITSLGIMVQKMEIAKKQTEEYQKEIDKLNEQYKSGAISEQEYNDRLVELKNSQWDAIDSYESAKDAIIDINEARVDMIEEGINKEIEAYEELIKLKQDELQSERD